MIPSKFNFHNAKNISEAIELVSSLKDAETKFISGGHSLLPMMKLRIANPDNVINIKNLSELKFIKKQANMLIIGSGTTHNEVAQSKDVLDSLPFLSKAASQIGDLQVRNFGTIGGSIAHADPAADWPTLCLVTNAEIVVIGPEGERIIPADNFFKGFFETELNDNELITEIKFPLVPNTKSSYMKFQHPASRYAIVGCAIQLIFEKDTISKVHVAYTGLSSLQFRHSDVEKSLIGKSLTSDTISGVTKLVTQNVDVISDVFASAEYKKHLAEVLTKKVLEQLL